MANKRKLTVDKTFLSLDAAETRGFIHRDYIAHCLRWTHVIKRLMRGKTYEGSKLLDVGCGRELPLAKTLYSSRVIPAEYVGVDVGPINDDAASDVTCGKFPCRLYEDTDLIEDEFLDDELGTFDFITCFEVLEHVEPQHMVRMLMKMRRLVAKPHGEVILSTPCWNLTDCAANHVDEMRYTTLGSVLEEVGFRIKEVYGTFASQRDYLHRLDDAQQVLFKRLGEYYDSNFLSCVFAPLFPAESRNALWVLIDDPMGARYQRRFAPIGEQPTPLGSSDKWADVNNWLAELMVSEV